MFLFFLSCLPKNSENVDTDALVISGKQDSLKCANGSHSIERNRSLSAQLAYADAKALGTLAMRTVTPIYRTDDNGTVSIKMDNEDGVRLTDTVLSTINIENDIISVQRCVKPEASTQILPHEGVRFWDVIQAEAADLTSSSTYSIEDLLDHFDVDTKQLQQNELNERLKTTPSIAQDGNTLTVRGLTLHENNEDHLQRLSQCYENASWNLASTGLQMFVEITEDFEDWADYQMVTGTIGYLTTERPGFDYHEALFERLLLKIGGGTTDQWKGYLERSNESRSTALSYLSTPKRDLAKHYSEYESLAYDLLHFENRGYKLTSFIEAPNATICSFTKSLQPISKFPEQIDELSTELDESNPTSSEDNGANLEQTAPNVGNPIQKAMQLDFPLENFIQEIRDLLIEGQQLNPSRAEVRKDLLDRLDNFEPWALDLFYPELIPLSPSEVQLIQELKDNEGSAYREINFLYPLMYSEPILTAFNNHAELVQMPNLINYALELFRHIEGEILVTNQQFETEFLSRYQKINHALKQVQSYQSSNLRYTDSIIELMIFLKEPMREITEEQRKVLRERAKLGFEELDAAIQELEEKEEKEKQRLLNWLLK